MMFVCNLLVALGLFTLGFVYGVKECKKRSVTKKGVDADGSVND